MPIKFFYSGALGPDLTLNQCLNNMLEVVIKEGQLNAALELAAALPEFENPYPVAEYRRRLEGVKHLILVAYVNNEPVGFKIGYERHRERSFYSWMGGTLPAYRHQNIASKLADYQEAWAQKRNYRVLSLKTRNKHKAMLNFAIRRGFYITGVSPKTPPQESRISMEKSLT